MGIEDFLLKIRANFRYICSFGSYLLLSTTLIKETDNSVSNNSNSGLPYVLVPQHKYYAFC